MTTTQIQYQTMMENKRHNKVTEHQAFKERVLTASQLRETIRSHKANEDLTGKSILETERSNKAKEKLTATQLQEIERHNRAGEKLTGKDLKEKKRHNKASEKETKRSNKANESIEKGKLSESKRHNKASESTERTKAEAQKSQAETAAKRQKEDAKTAEVARAKTQAETNLLDTRFENYKIELLTKTGDVGQNAAAMMLGGEIVVDKGGKTVNNLLRVIKQGKNKDVDIQNYEGYKQLKDPENAAKINAASERYRKEYLKNFEKALKDNIALGMRNDQAFKNAEEYAKQKTKPQKVNLK